MASLIIYETMSTSFVLIFQNSQIKQEQKDYRRTDKPRTKGLSKNKQEQKDSTQIKDVPDLSDKK